MIYIHGKDDYEIKVLSLKGKPCVGKDGLVTIQGDKNYKGFEKIQVDILLDEFYPADIVKGF